MTGSPELILKREFSNGNLQTETNTDRFATTFAVDPKLVKEYVQHINDLKQRSQTRAAHRGRKSQQLRQKTFEEYDRLKTINSGRRNQQNESIRTRQMSGQTQSSYRVKGR